MINDKFYSRLQDVVGERNITRTPAILDTYAFQWGYEIESAQRGDEPSRFGQRPDAVVLPTTTEEVQTIVKICNEFKVTFKPFSTGMGPWAGVSEPGAIQIDLRRMNRIVEVDPNNLYVVVEPYVTNSELQAELFQYGLMHHAQGAGPQTSPLASHTSFVGPGFTSPYTGFSGRNLLGAEWVAPNGEILRLGSYEHTGKWFTGDGPGFSLRGVIRGWMGAYGGLGVFTKAAIKLYSYPAPKDWTWNISGTIPKYEWEVPKYWKLIVLNFQEWEQYESAFYEVSDHDVVMMATTSSSEGLAALFTDTKMEAIEVIFGGLLARTRRYFIILIAAHTEREYNYRVKLIRTIMKKYEGEDLIEEGFISPRSAHYAETIRNMLGGHAFRFSNCFQSTHGGMDTVAMAVKLAQVNQPIKSKYIEKGVIGDDRGEGIWTTTYEGGHMAHLEVPTVYDGASKESCLGYAEYQDECNDVDLKQAYGMPFFIVGDKVHDYYASRTMDYPKYLRRIKAAFDPNGISDSSHYVSAKNKSNE
ncbi:MAG: FAD-binding oxidoreductase [Candidatus Thorarchaeota archaeon]|nr:FAD-binding oxidoreductase [Candidatus Thorarchaeota archaeon]